MAGKKSSLGLGLATSLVAGNMIGSGIYLLPASLGSFGSISLLGWIGALAVAIIYAAMFACAALLPAREGRGIIQLIRQAFGSDCAFVAAGLYWLQALLGNVAIALAVTGYLLVIVPWSGGSTGIVFTTLAVIWGFISLNLTGARSVGRFEAVGLLVGLLPVLMIGSVGWLYFDPDLFAAEWNISGRADHAVIPELVVLVLWAFLGLESASVAADLVANPKRNVPLATIGGVLLAAVIYIAASTVLLGIMPAQALASSTAPFADASALILGTAVGMFVAICAALKASATLAGWILLTAESGGACSTVDTPPADHGSRPPRKQLLFAGVLMSLVVVATADDSLAAQFGQLINAVVIVMLCFYAIVGLALIRAASSVDPGLAMASRWFGAGGAAISVLIVVMQDWPTILTAGCLILAIVLVRVLSSKMRRKRSNLEQ